MLPIMAEEMKKISGCLRRHLHLPKTRDGGTSATDTSLSDRVPIYDEHQLFMDQLAGRYSESNINLSDPLNSSGLTQAKAASLLEVMESIYFKNINQ